MIGVGVAVTLGLPTLVAMQEKAALENVVGQFEEVRAAANDMFVADEARYPTVAIPAGRVAVEPGTHVLVTSTFATEAAACDFRVTGWSDWDGTLTVSATGCTALAASTSDTCNGASGTAQRCLELARVVGSVETPIPYDAVGAGPYTVTFRSGATVDEDADYVFRLTNNRAAANRVVYGEAWLLHMDRLRWTLTGVEATYEGGAIFAKDPGGVYLASTPAVSEDPEGDEPFFLRFATMQGSTYSALTGADSHAMGLVFQSGHLRVDHVQARLLHLDFHGDFAQGWCNAFLVRDTLAALGGDHYTEDDPAHACNAANSDRLTSVKYAEDGPFHFTLSQSVIHGALHV